jgi:hypothetical protein
LIHLFAILLIIHAPEEILSFCSNISISKGTETQSGLQILVTKWLEVFEIIQGYNEIRLSVVALSRIFDFGDGIMVKGDEIIDPSSRIVTRSQRKKGNFLSGMKVILVQFTLIPLKLKIIKLFIKELDMAEGESVPNGLERKEVDEEGWEDEDSDDDDSDDDNSSEREDLENQDESDSQNDLLKGIDAKVTLSSLIITIGLCDRFLEKGRPQWRKMGIVRVRSMGITNKRNHLRSMVFKESWSISLSAMSKFYCPTTRNL